MKAASSSAWNSFDCQYHTHPNSLYSSISIDGGAAATVTADCAEIEAIDIAVAMRPNTLNVSRDKRHNDTHKFIREALHAWRAKARCNVVPAERLHDLFEELNFCPTEKQINEMLQTAKLFARRGSSLDAGGSGKRVNGLTFGEFCVLAADLKRFRTQNLTRCHDNKSSLPGSGNATTSSSSSVASSGSATSSSSLSSSSSTVPGLSNLNSENVATGGAAAAAPSDVNAPEVFLGGSCNPTTWRADVAIPALNKLGISFYNPQVSDWTPDLIELEHRAKEKARVLFFVMDSETRASAGAIEAAHIAGQNSRHLVLVLHPYKPEQSILNEPISPQEFLDLKRNQELLKELVIRRGLPVLDSIPSGLQRTRAILDGTSERRAPYNIASRLISVRRAFDLVADQTLDGKITIAQCQCALPLLGYAQNLLSTENLKNIIDSHRESTDSCPLAASSTEDGSAPAATASVSSPSKIKKENGGIFITFDEFCMMTSYLAILQQEIHESGCISPIKGTNLPPPPIFLTNTPEWTHNQHPHDTPMTSMTIVSYSKQIFRTSSCKSVPEEHCSNGSSSDLYRNRDSGTSSPQPQEPAKLPPPPTGTKSVSNHTHIGKKTKISLNVEYFTSEHEDESDSNDSVFSSGSSTDSNLGEAQLRRGGLEIRDIYLGGSCMLRTSWRKDCAIPYFNQKGVTFHLPVLHESICSFIPECNEASESAENGATEASGTNTMQQQQPQQQQATNSSKSSKKLLQKIRIKKLYTTMTTSPINADDHHNNQLQQVLPNDTEFGGESNSQNALRKPIFNSAILDSSRVLLFVITNETRSLAPMTLAAHYIGLGYNVVLCVQMLPDFCIIGTDKLTPAAIKDYNRGRAYLIDLAKRQGVPVFSDLKQTLECAVEKVKTSNSRNSI